jgi:hypothetical protein
MAQARSGQACAQASSRSAWDSEARTRSSASGSSASPIATAVCEALCGSTPIITATTGNLLRLFLTSGKDRGGHAQFQGSHWRSRLF